jgi:WD40 repeat protein
MRPKAVKRITLAGPRTVESLSWSADSRRIAVGSVLDARVGVYDVATGAKVAGPPNRVGGVNALAHSPDGRYLAIAHGRMETRGQSYAVSLWDPVTGAHVQDLVESWDDIKVFNAMTLAFSPDSRYLAVVYQVGTFFYDVQTAGRARAVGRTLPGLAIAFTPNSQRLAVPSIKGIIFADVPSGRITASIADYPNRVGFSPDARFFISSSQCQAQVYALGPDDSFAGRREVYFEHNANVMSVSVSPDSRLLALGGGRIVKLLSLSELALVATLTNHHDIVLGARFSPDGARIAAFGGPSGPTIWQLQ